MGVHTTSGPVDAQTAELSSARKLLGNYWFNRTIKALFTIFVVITFTFFLVRLMPGSPIQVFIHQQIAEYGLSYDEAASLAASLFAIDLDTPMIQQFISYLGNLVRGDMGRSLLSRQPVLQNIAAYLPWTLFSVGVGVFVSFLLGVLLGMLMAYRRESILDHVLSAFASITSSVPNYLVAIMILVFLGVQWGILPIHQMRGSLSPGIKPGFTLEFILDALFHAAMPISVYILTTIGNWMLTMKSSTIGALGEDFVTVARARGIRDRRISTVYVGRNAILPLFTQLTLAMGFVVGGSVLIEVLFTYRGVGWILFDAITQRDYPMMQGVFLVIAVSVVAANLAADFLYGRLDPRIRLGREDL